MNKVTAELSLNLTFTQGQRLLERWKSSSHSVVKWIEIVYVFAMFEYKRKMNAKEHCKYMKCHNNTFGGFRKKLFSLSRYLTLAERKVQQSQLSKYFFRWFDTETLFKDNTFLKTYSSVNFQ